MAVRGGPGLAAVFRHKPRVLVSTRGSLPRLHCSLLQPGCSASCKIKGSL